MNNFLNSLTHSISDVLGDRLASSNDPILKKESQLCYICSGNLNKMIQSSEGDVQDIVELVTIMQKVLELQGAQDVRIEGNVAVLLSQYAEMLAAEGNLEAALIYLGNSQEERITALRDRLCHALGYIKQPTQQANPRASISSQQSYYSQSRKPSQPHVQQYQSGYDAPQPVAAQNTWNTTPTKQSYAPVTSQFAAPPQPGQFGTVPNQSVQSNDPYAPKPYGWQPAALAAQPLPPPPTVGSNSTGSRPSSVGPQSRSKYILDPSVKTSTFGSSYGNQNSFAPAPNVYNSQPQSQVAPVQGFPQQGTFQQPQSIAQPTFYPTQQPQSQTPFYNQPQNDASKPPPANVLNPLQNAAQPSLYNPVAAQPPPQAQSYSNEHSYQNSSQSGWNDPPIANTTRAQVNEIFVRNTR